MGSSPTSATSLFKGFYIKRRSFPASRGPLVKRLRHRPFTAVTGVRFSHGSPKKKTSEPFGSDVFFLSKPTKEAWYGIRRLRRHEITSKTCMSSRASVYLRRLDSIHPFGMIQKRKHPNFQFGCFLFIQADEGGLVWHPSLATAWNHVEDVYVITRKRVSSPPTILTYSLSPEAVLFISCNTAPARAKARNTFRFHRQREKRESLAE